MNLRDRRRVLKSQFNQNEWIMQINYSHQSQRFLFPNQTCVQPNNLSTSSNRHESTINPVASLVKLRHQDRSKLRKFMQFLARDRAVWFETWNTPHSCQQKPILECRAKNIKSTKIISVAAQIGEGALFSSSCSLIQLFSRYINV